MHGQVLNNDGLLLNNGVASCSEFARIGFVLCAQVLNWLAGNASCARDGS
jgi:hypothetical protein